MKEEIIISTKDMQLDPKKDQAELESLKPNSQKILPTDPKALKDELDPKNQKKTQE